MRNELWIAASISAFALAACDGGRETGAARDLVAPAETVETENVGNEEAAEEDAGEPAPVAGTATEEDEDARVADAPFTILTASSDAHGAYITDATGRALYLFTADGTDAGEPLACQGDCLEAWPPAEASGALTAADGARSDLAATRRADDRRVVTYGGYPLYYFARDDGPNETQGQGIESFGGVWRLVAPDGTAIDGE